MITLIYQGREEIMAFRILWFGVIPLLLLLTFSCKNDPASSEKKPSLELDAVLSANAGLGWQINEIVTTGHDIFFMTGGPEAEEPDELGNLPTMRKLKSRAISLYNDQKMHLQHPESAPIFLKPMDETLLFFAEDTIQGTKIGAYYNTVTGIARIFAVQYKFGPLRVLAYDSIEIKIDTHFTLEDDTDDQITNFKQLELYKPTYLVQRVEGNIDFTDYDGNVLTGLELTVNTYYHERLKLQMLVQYVEINPDGSATFREDFTFDDGKSSYNLVNFYPNNSGDYEKKLRDGTIISGTFAISEAELQAVVTQLIDLPPGRFIDKIMKSAQVWVTLPDTILNASYDEIVYFKSGDIDSGHVDIQVQGETGVTMVTFNVTKKNNAHGSFEYLEYDEGTATLTGDWTTWNQYYILLEGEYYLEGSAHIHYEVYAPPYNEGDDPVLVVDYDILPDGSGEGTITYQGEQYTITFEKFGEATITKGDASTTINLY
jgi:hypothetical protein